MNNFLPLAQLPAGACVLDLGCGSGTVSYTRFPQLRFFGTEQFAHTESGSWPPNAWIVRAEAEQLPWASSAFDAAICGYVFEHFRDPRSALRELNRVIRPGGLLYIAIPRSSSLEDRLYRFTFKGGGHIQLYGFDTFISLVYQQSSFKLEGMGLAPGGFTWLRDVPLGNLIRRLIYRSFRTWRRATGNNPLEANDYLLLFRLGEQRGYQQIHVVCSQCGAPISEYSAGSNGLWKCPVCSFDNILVAP